MGHVCRQLGKQKQEDGESQDSLELGDIVNLRLGLQETLFQKQNKPKITELSYGLTHTHIHSHTHSHTHTHKSHPHPQSIPDTMNEAILTRCQQDPQFAGGSLFVKSVACVYSGC